MIGALRSANMRNMISTFDTLSQVNDRNKIVFGSFTLSFWLFLKKEQLGISCSD